jgi:hypothetical protein
MDNLLALGQSGKQHTQRFGGDQVLGAKASCAKAIAFDLCHIAEVEITRVASPS